MVGIRVSKAMTAPGMQPFRTAAFHYTDFGNFRILA